MDWILEGGDNQSTSFPPPPWPFGVSLGLVCSHFHWIVHMCLSPLFFFMGREGRNSNPLSRVHSAPSICLLGIWLVRDESLLITPFVLGVWERAEPGVSVLDSAVPGRCVVECETRVSFSCKLSGRALDNGTLVIVGAFDVNPTLSPCGLMR